MSAPSEMRVLVAAIRSNGYKVVRTGNGAHQKVLRKNGSQVADANGPLIISGSPSEHRWRDMHVNRLMNAGVLKEDPWNPRKKSGDGGGVDEDGKTQKQRDEETAKARKARDLHDRSEVFRVRTGRVRADVEPIVGKLGGWSHGGSGVKVADFSAVLRFWAEQNDPKVIPLTGGKPFATSSWVAQVTNLRTVGGTIGEKWLPLFEAFVVALHEGNENSDPNESSLVYLDLLRASKGILPEPVEEEEPDERPKVSATRVVVEWPRVALEALFWMSRGADGQDRDTILDLAEEIAELAATNEERKNDR